MDLTPHNLGGVGTMYVEDEYMPFKWDGEKFSPLPDMALETGTARRKNKIKVMSDSPIDEWHTIFAMIPEQVVEKQLQGSSCFTKMLNQRIGRIPENTINFDFLGSDSLNRGKRLPLTLNIGIPPTLKTDNAQNKIGRNWSEHCQKYCIKQKTIEPHLPQKNPAEPKIDQLNSMDIPKIDPNLGSIFMNPYGIIKGKMPKDPWQKAREHVNDDLTQQVEKLNEIELEFLYRGVKNIQETDPEAINGSLISHNKDSGEDEEVSQGSGEGDEMKEEKE
eukprot:5722884-Ditylum_brightwellii.AAC.1